MNKADYFKGSVQDGFLAVFIDDGCKTLENERVSIANDRRFYMRTIQQKYRDIYHTPYRILLFKTLALQVYEIK